MTDRKTWDAFIARCLKPFAFGKRHIAWADPKLTLVSGDTIINSACGADEILEAPQGTSWVFGNPNWEEWLTRHLVPTMCHDLGGSVTAHFRGAYACKEGSRIEVPKIEGLGTLMIYLPSESEGGAISLSFDEQEPITFGTASPNELRTIVW